MNTFKTRIGTNVSSYDAANLIVYEIEPLKLENLKECEKDGLDLL